MVTELDEAVLIRDLRKSYGAQRALDGLSLTVARGECLGLLGPNGAGKTTTIRILSTLTARDAGEVRVLGLDPMLDVRALRARIGVVPQEIALYDDLTARENLEFLARMYGLAPARVAERTDAALEHAGLVERSKDRVGTYSGGMKRRLNIVAGMIHEPELVFLDEPTVGVDPHSRNHVYAMVDEMRARGTTIVYTTHQLGEVERLCDRIVILDRGRSVAAGTFDELRRSVGPSGRRARLVCAERTEEAHAILAQNGFDVALEEDLPNLEEVFLTLTGHQLRDGGS